MKPVVLDVAQGFEPALLLGDRQAFRAWLEQEGLEDQLVYRLEIDPEHKTAAVFSYAKNAYGRPYHDPNHNGRVAERELYTIWLHELPLAAVLKQNS